MASAKILEQKQQIVAELADKMKNAKSGVLVNYQGVSVADDTKLRSDLRKAGVDYTVVKNTLTSRACDLIGFDQLKEHLVGMNALAVSDDPIAPAKILYAFAEKNENFVIKAGFVDGEYLDAEGVKQLAKIPSKEVLIGKVLGSLQSSLYSFAYVLQAIIDKNSEGAASAEANA
ncbi:MAG TPA: 50S ribosomal protein L10 [Bacillota bacterium]|nr:50S ribosomal protein L10 [Bacillota bacterium]HOK68883.1 50S ribosomal protein L10 [Bacillota bacterium]HPP84688.1 50S ribosomal protein L10 [Bacillota bacterium]